MKCTQFSLKKIKERENNEVPVQWDAIDKVIPLLKGMDMLPVLKIYASVATNCVNPMDEIFTYLRKMNVYSGMQGFFYTTPGSYGTLMRVLHDTLEDSLQEKIPAGTPAGDNLIAELSEADREMFLSVMPIVGSLYKTEYEDQFSDLKLAEEADESEGSEKPNGSSDSHS